jgi:thiosulfate/3-mercaptopyruvate sulfurtransferase
MTFRTLIPCGELAARLGDGRCVPVDCRFALSDPSSGERAYVGAHVPGAVYAHLEWHLSSPVVTGVTGRHPLPDPARLAKTLGLWGIGPDSQVVAYDDAGGAMAAARLWWLLRWLGHDAVAVLDGGWQAWIEGGHEVASGPQTREERVFEPSVWRWMAVDADTVSAVHCAPDHRLLDVRSADRYRGENETIDPVAGHIPCARSAPYAENLGPDGRFRPAAELREHYSRLLESVSADRVIVYCGSGVTAAHTVLAMEHAGIGLPRLYAGSWSEWITDAARPVARGPDPDGARRSSVPAE